MGKQGKAQIDVTHTVPSLRPSPVAQSWTPSFLARLDTHIHLWLAPTTENPGHLDDLCCGVAVSGRRCAWHGSWGQTDENVGDEKGRKGRGRVVFPLLFPLLALFLVYCWYFLCVLSVHPTVV